MEFNSVRPDERSSHTTGTKSLNQSCQPSMAMGEVSIALSGAKLVHGALILLLVASSYSNTVSLGPLDSSTHSLRAFRTYPDHHCPSTTPVLFSTMPQDRGKPGRASKNKNAYTCDNRLTASKQALISHFSHPCTHTSNPQTTMRTPELEILSPKTQTSMCTPKEETLSPTMHSQLLPLLSPTIASRAEIPPSLNLEKEEAPPPLQHIGPPSSSQPDPSLELKEDSPSIPDFQPRRWEGGCIIEEEIPPSWQVSEGKENIHYLVEQHLELLFDIRQRQDEQGQGQRIINQRLDLLYEAFSDAPKSASCPTCKQKFVSAFTSNGRLGSPLA